MEYSQAGNGFLESLEVREKSGNQKLVREKGQSQEMVWEFGKGRNSQGKVGFCVSVRL